MNQSFHNTISLEGPELDRHEAKAVSQEIRIYDWLVKRPNQKFTPIEIHEQCCPECLLTSTRRALSNLTKAGKLKNTRWTEDKKKERYGTPNYKWYYELKTDTNGQINML